MSNNDVNENYIQTNYGCVDKVFNEDNLEEYREDIMKILIIYGILT